MMIILCITVQMTVSEEVLNNPRVITLTCHMQELVCDIVVSGLGKLVHKPDNDCYNINLLALAKSIASICMPATQRLHSNGK